jgi:hypothetical protein
MSCHEIAENDRNLVHMRGSKAIASVLAASTALAVAIWVLAGPPAADSHHQGRLPKQFAVQP